MKTIIRRILCCLQFHQHEEVIDEALTREFNEIWPFASQPSPCTYLVCKHCGHSYGSRMIQVTSSRGHK